MSSHPEAVITDMQLSEDGKTLTEGMAIGPYGNYDPDAQLTDEQIIEFKKKFLDDESARAWACAEIAANLMDDLVGFEDGYSTAEADKKIVDELTLRSAHIAAIWMSHLERALELPDAEWPEGMSPPVTFSDALKAANEKIERFEI